MDDLCGRLKAWGMATVARHARQHDGPSGGNSTLADISIGTRKPAVEVLLARSGIGRRMRMAQAANAGIRGGVGMSIAPMWSCDPVPARNDASRPTEHAKAWVDIGLPDEARPIDDAIAQMARNHPLRAAVVREEYTTTGKQEAKAARVQAAYGGKLTLRQYRMELEKAKEWLRGRVG